MHSLFRLRPAVAMTKLALACLLAQSASVQAQDSAAAPVTVLEEVTVTASGYEQNVEDAPASVTIITGDELRKRSFRDLTDALRDVEGVTVNGGANET